MGRLRMVERLSFTMIRAIITTASLKSRGMLDFTKLLPVNNNDLIDLNDFLLTNQKIRKKVSKVFNTIFI